MRSVKVTLVGLMLVTFHMSARSRMSEYEKRQKQDAEASAAWLDTVFPVHLSDADESVDGVAETDFSPAYAAIVMVSESTGCHDFDCLATAITCDICKFGAGEPEEAEEADLAAVLKDIQAVDALREKSKDAKGKKGPSFFHQGRREAQFDLYELASTCRGSRGRAELQISGRMGC